MYSVHSQRLPNGHLKNIYPPDPEADRELGEAMAARKKAREMAPQTMSPAESEAPEKTTASKTPSSTPQPAKK